MLQLTAAKHFRSDIFRTKYSHQLRSKYRVQTYTDYRLMQVD